MYIETDFILALLKEDDWLSERAEEIYETEENLWTSEYTLIELMMVAYREDRNIVRAVSEAIELIDIRGDAERIEAAAVYVQEENLTPFDALHLVVSGEDTIVSSDKDYSDFSNRKKLEEGKD